MKLLAFDTSTELISIAVTRTVDGQARVWQHTGAGGAQASSGLIPAIETLMGEAGLDYASLDAIAFGQGPGSFTGLRTACAVAQGLGFGAGVPLLPIDTLLAVAEEARLTGAQPAAAWRVQALLDARMDEVYAARYDYQDGAWASVQDYQLLRPELVAAQDIDALVGNVFEVYGERLQQFAPTLPRCPALPSATAMLRLAPALLVQGQALAAKAALPRYIRDKVAKTTLERAAEKAAAQSP